MTKPKPKHLHKKRGREKGCKQWNEIVWTPTMKQEICTSYALGLSIEDCADEQGISKDTLDDERKRDPDFAAAMRKAFAKAKKKAVYHTDARAFPFKDGKPVKGDARLAELLLRLKYRMGASDLEDAIKALAPLIQFTQKEPAKDGQSLAPTGANYFDASKEIEAS
jgi:hypothetical protein